jgi:uncharacterized membrane protein
MAVLFAIVYPDQATAEQAALTTRGLVDAGFLNLLDSSLITKNAKGKIEHHGERHTVRTGLLSGALIGGVTGLLFLVPVAGIAAGAAFGGLIGKWAKSGASSDFERFRDQVSADLQPGGAALLLLCDVDARERLIHDLGQHGGIIRSTDISDEQLAEIQQEVDKSASLAKSQS